MSKYLVGGNIVVVVDNSSAAAQIVTPYITEIEAIGKEFNEIDDTVLSDTAESVIAGIEKAQSITIKGFADDTATTGWDTVVFGSTGIVGVVGSVKIIAKASVRSFLAEMLCTSAKYTGKVGEFWMLEATFKQDGAMSVGALAS